MWVWNGGSPRWEHVVGIKTGTTRHDPVPVVTSGDGTARLKVLGAITTAALFDTEMQADPSQAVQDWWDTLSSTEKTHYYEAVKSLKAKLA